MSLKQAYRDFILLTVLTGLIFTSVVTLNEYIATHNTFYAELALIFGLLWTVSTIARTMFVVDF